MPDFSPPGVGADIYFNRGDDATVAARVAHDFGLVDSLCGQMGHSNIFMPAKLSAWDPYIMLRLKAHLAP